MYRVIITDNRAHVNLLIIGTFVALKGIEILKALQ